MKLIEHFILCPEIWCSAEISLQKELLDKTFDLIDTSMQSPKQEDLVDAVLNAIQSYIIIDSDRYIEVTDLLWDHARKHAKENISYGMFKAICGYCNCLYMKRIPNYPLVVLYAVKILMEMLISNKDSFTKVIKEEIKAKNRSKVIDNVLGLFNYMVEYLKIYGSSSKANQSKEMMNGIQQDKTLEYYFDNKFEIIDQIFSVCLHIILKFNWKSLCDLSKEILKFETSKSDKSANNKLEETLVSFLIKQLVKITSPSEFYVCDSILTKKNECGVLGKLSFKTLLAILFDQPNLVLNESKTESNFKSSQLSITNKSMDLFAYILAQAIKSFTDDAKKEVVSFLLDEAKLMSELSLSPAFLKLIFSLSQMVNDARLCKLQADWMFSVVLMFDFHTWKYLAGTPTHKLNVIDECIELTLSQFPGYKPDYNYAAINCLELAYFLEDTLEAHFTSDASQLFIKVLGKLILLFNKLDILYLSMPILTVIDSRNPISFINRQEREGGILRIILKAIFISMKNANSEDILDLLLYIIFREKEAKTRIKKLTGLDRSNYKKSVKSSKGRNLSNLILQVDSTSLDTLNKYWTRNIIVNEMSLLTNVEVGKSNELLEKEMNYFQNPITLFLYLFTSLMQLAYYELFDGDALPEEEASLTVIAKAYESKGKVPTTNFIRLIQIMKEILVKDTNKITNMLTVNIEKHFTYCKERLRTLPCPEFKLSNIHSTLNFKNEHTNGPISSSMNSKLWDNTFKKFISNWVPFVKGLLSAVEDFSKENTSQVITVLLDLNGFFVMYPMLLILTNTSFAKLDKYIHLQAISNSKTNQEQTSKVISGLTDKIWSQLPNSRVNRSKFRRDEYISDLDFRATTLCKRVLKEQHAKLGCWYDKDKAKYRKHLALYVIKRYNKTLKGKDDCHDNPYKSFVKQSLYRDNMGRALILKECSIDEEKSNGYEYLRTFILKKLLIQGICKEKLDYDHDFKFKLVRTLFSTHAKLTNAHEEKKEEKSIDNDEFVVIKEEDIKECDDSFQKTINSIDDNILKQREFYEAEMITVKGTIFGWLLIDGCTISFRSVKRPQNDRYRYGPAKFNQLDDPKVFKEWSINKIEQVIIKRYNYIRQCIEIYFNSYNSVLFALFSKKNSFQFMNDLKEIVRKRPDCKIDLIFNTKNYFSEMKFRESWTKGRITNFNYLMLVNKCAERSFNDLNQYPVFPWILKDYKASALNFENANVYRPLSMTIAGITAEKRHNTDKQPATSTNQYETHYLPYHVVVNYLLRLNPYAQQYCRCEHDSKNGLFTSVAGLWEKCLTCVNNELIPEFFCFPEMFNNHNYKPIGSSKTFTKSIALPSWAKTTHVFVQNNVMALESPYVSSELDKWVELVFGIKQQDSRSYNSFKPACERQLILTKAKLSDEQIESMQKMGVNPMKLFEDKHPAKLMAPVKSQMLCGIFEFYKDEQLNTKEANCEELSSDENRLFVFKKVKTIEEGQPIVFIESFDNCVKVITNSQKMYHAKADFTNAVNEKNVNFTRDVVSVFPFESFFDELERAYQECDSQRCFAVIKNGELILTCRHFDNSWKLSKCSNGEIVKSISFHNAMITNICTNENKNRLFTGTDDGVVAMWLLNEKKLQRPEWCFSSHSQKLVSLDASSKLELVASASLDRTVVLRRINDGKLIHVLKPKIKNYKLAITHVRLSYRGYVIIIAECKSTAAKFKGCIFVYSINGELIKFEAVKDCFSSIIVSDTGYEFILSNRSGRIYKYGLLTLRSIDVLESMDNGHTETVNVIKEILLMNLSITAMCLTKKDCCQHLFIGTNTGSLYVIKSSLGSVGLNLINALNVLK